MTIYGNKINLDLKEYLSMGHSTSELEKVEGAGFDVILTSLGVYVGVICGSGHALDENSYAEAETQYNKLYEGAPFDFAGTKSIWIVEEEDIVL